MILSNLCNFTLITQSRLLSDLSDVGWNDSPEWKENVLSCQPQTKISYFKFCNYNNKNKMKEIPPDGGKKKNFELLIDWLILKLHKSMMPKKKMKKKK